MTISRVWIWLLVWGAAAAASSTTTRHPTVDSSFLSDIQSTRAVLSRTILEASTLTTRLSIKTPTSSTTSTTTNIAETNPDANPETVEARTASELDPSLQIVFLVLGTLFGLASVVVAIFFGHKQRNITTNQSSAERNHDVELAELDAASDGVIDLTTRNHSHTLNVAFIHTLESATIHIANALQSHLVAIWTFMRHPGDLVLPSVVAVRSSESPNAGHEPQMHPAEPHG